jgi:dolichyl-phosphate-mannose-protein mannosyltransferase
VSGLGWKSALVAVASFAYLAHGVERTGIASALANAVDGIHAQDESIYANAALRTAAQGNWLTPVVMGRLYFHKPPLLYIFTGLSLKAFGPSLFALRLPSLLAGSLTAALLFLWCAGARGLWAGLTAVLLLLSNSVWVTFARLCYTDTLLAFFTVAAMFAVACDPRLDTTAARWGFIAFEAAAILTKSVAGVLPLLALAVFAALGPREQRPAMARILRVIAWIALLIAPWHLYQLLAHRQWFFTEYIKMELFQWALHPPVPRSDEITAWFYLKRLFLTDPFLCAGALLTLPLLVLEFRKRKTDARWLACWLAVVAIAVFSYQWRNFPYVLMLLAPLCLMVAYYIPAKYQRAALLLAVLVLGLKLLPGNRVWSLNYSTSQPLAATPVLRSYADRARSNELILVDTDDEFSSSTLPLPKVRYCFRDPGNVTVRYAPYFVDLGITVNSDVFSDLDRWEPIFRDHLRAWGLDSSEPIATTIVARNDADVVRIIQSHADSDFYLPMSLQPAVGAAAQSTHTIVPASTGRFFLLANRSASRVPARSSMLQ